MISCIIFFGISLIVLILNEKQLQEERELRNYMLEILQQEKIFFTENEETEEESN